MFTVGDKVGPYEIVAKLKAGGMATLFLGRRSGAAGFAKLVAIKVVHEHLAQDPTFVQMFVDEALLSARIQHPNVVHVEELREFEGRHFLVMEFVYGCSLGQLLRELGTRQRRLSPELAIYIAIKIADGLHAAHEVRDSQGVSLGVVHRDISPQNILLAYQGNVKLIDFGVAKARGAAKTLGGNIKGKFRYMSPEQAHVKELDRRSDIYALGIVLWEMLTMRRRFHAKSDMEILDIVRDPRPIPPSELAGDLPTGLDEVVLMAMATDPEERFQTAMEFRQALAGIAPLAAAMHESELGSLLGVAMADRIVVDRESLPSNLSGVTLDVPTADSSNGADAMEALTMGAIDVEIMDSSEVSAVERAEQATRRLEAATGELHEQATQMIDPASGEFADAEEERTIFQTDIEERMHEVFGGTPPAVMIPQDEPAPRGIHPGLLAVIAVALLVVAGGTSFGLVLAFRGATVEAAPPGVVPSASSVTSAPVPEPSAPDASVAVAVATEPPASADAGTAPIGAAANPNPDPQPQTRTPTGRRRRGTTAGRRRGTGGATGRGRRRHRPIASEW